MPTYALRACSRALLVASMPAPASSSQVAAGGHRWLLTAVRGHLGGHALGTLVMRSPGARAAAQRAGALGHYRADLQYAAAGERVSGDDVDRLRHVLAFKQVET